MLRRELLEKLESVEPAFSTIDLIPLLTHAWLMGDSIMGYNDQIAIKVPCPIKLRCAIPGRTLISLLKNSTIKEVEMTMNGEEVLVKLGKKENSNIRLGMIPPDDFKIFEMPSPEKGTRLPVEFSKFKSAIECCMRSISTDTSIPDQLGITLLAKGDILDLYSTNNSTISHAQVKLDKKPPFERVVLSEPFCKAMLALKPSDPKIYIHADHSLFVADGLVLFGRLIEVDKPIPFVRLLEHHLPQSHKKKLVKIPDRFPMMLARAMVITDSPTQQTQTTFTVKNGTMTLLSTSGRGEIKDRITVNGHPEVSVKLEPKLISLGLEDFDKFLVTDQCAIMAKGSKLYMIAATQT